MGIGAFNKEFDFDHALLLTASSMFTATSSCFVLGKNFPFKSRKLKFHLIFSKSDFVLVAVILLSTKYKINPDNMVSFHFVTPRVAETSSSRTK